MATWDEGSIRFEFGSTWSIVKLDEDVGYRSGIEKVDQTKAVDFAGVNNKDDLFLIEVKDFRGYRIENKQRLANGELAVEIAQKVRDSIACIIGCNRMYDTPDTWSKMAKLLANKTRDIRIVIWLEHDLPSNPKLRTKANAAIATDVFKKKLFWLTTKVLVADSNGNILPDVNISNLPKPTK